MTAEFLLKCPWLPNVNEHRILVLGHYIRQHDTLRWIKDYRPKMWMAVELETDLWVKWSDTTASTLVAQRSN